MAINKEYKKIFNDINNNTNSVNSYESVMQNMFGKNFKNDLANYQANTSYRTITQPSINTTTTTSSLQKASQIKPLETFGAATYGSLGTGVIDTVTGIKDMVDTASDKLFGKTGNKITDTIKDATGAGLGLIVPPLGALNVNQKINELTGLDKLTPEQKVQQKDAIRNTLGINQANQYAQERASENKTNAIANFGGQVVGGLVPTLATAYATGGTGVMPQVFSQTMGGKTEELLRSGDAKTLEEAQLKSLPYAGASALVERMGGIGAKNAAQELGKGIFKNALEEGTEEVIEDIIGRALDLNLMQGSKEDVRKAIEENPTLLNALSKAIYGTDSSVINPQSLAQSFAGGALGGGIYGGIGKLGNRTSIQPIQNVQPTVQNQENVQPIQQQKGNLTNINTEIGNLGNLETQLQQINAQNGQIFNNINSNELSQQVDSINQNNSETRLKNDLNESNFSQNSDLANLMIKNNETQKINTYINEISKKLGTKIEMAELENNINGKIQNDKITLNKKLGSQELINQISMHELTHQMQKQASDEYNKYKTFIADVIRQNENGTFDGLIQKYDNLYNKENNLNLNTEDITDEVVSDFNGILFGNDMSTLEKLASQNRTLAQKIIDMFKQIVSDIKVALGKGNVQNVNIKGFDISVMENNILRAENMLKNITEKSNQKVSVNEDTKYSIKEKADGSQYVKVDTDQNVFEGINSKDYNKIAKMYITDYLLGNTPLSENSNVLIDTIGRNKYTNPGKRQKNFDKKMQLTPELKNVLKIAKKVTASEVNKENSVYPKWEYYSIDFEIDGNTFNGLINIGIDENGNKHFYEINNIIKNTSGISHEANNPTGTKNIVSQNVNSVNRLENTIDGDNTKFSLKDSQGNELTQEQQEYFKDSKVKDENGNLKTLYHGTKSNFTIFKESTSGEFGPGIYLADTQDGASFYSNFVAKGDGTPKEMEVYANIKNPYIVNKMDYIRKTEKIGAGRFRDKLVKQGYDGIIGIGINGIDKQYVAFNSNQIKNIDNLNPTDSDDIRYSLKEREKGFLKTASESEKLNEDNRYEVLMKRIYDGSYVVKSNEETKNDAELIIENAQGQDEYQKLDSVYNQIKKNEYSNTGLESALLTEIIDKYQELGNNNKVLEVIDYLDDLARQQGRNIQYLAQWKALNGENKALWVKKTVDSYNKTQEGKKNPITFAQEEYESLNNYFKTLDNIVKQENDKTRELLEKSLKQELVNRADFNNSLERKLATNALDSSELTVQAIKEKLEQMAMAQVFRRADSTILKKVSTYQTMAHLLNTSTYARNILSNESMKAIDNVAKKVGGFITGNSILSTSLDKETKANIKKEAKRQSSETTLNILLGIDGFEGTKYSNANAKTVTGVRPTFKNKTLNSLEKVLGLELKVPDESMKTRVRENVKAQYRKALGEEGYKQYQDQIEKMADEEAKYITFQDDTWASKLLKNLKTTLNFGQEFGLGDFVVKYTQVPGNIIARGIEYSPLGAIKAIKRMVDIHSMKQAGEITRFEADKLSADVGRMLTGSTLMALGALLSQMGVLTSNKEEDEDLTNLLKDAGINPGRVNLSQITRILTGNASDKVEEGDILTDLSWLQPISTVVNAGITLHEDFEKERQDKILPDIIENFLDLPCNQSLSTIMQAYQYKDKDQNTLEALFYGTLQATGDSLAGFVPSIVRQTANAIDPVSRNTYSNKKEGTALGQLLKQTSKKTLKNIPFASKLVEPNIRADGEEKVYFDGGTLLNALIQASPSRLTKVNKIEGTDKIKEVLTTSDGESLAKSSNLPLRYAPNQTQYTKDEEGNKIPLNDKQKTVYMKAYSEYYRTNYIKYLGKISENASDKQKEKYAEQLAKINKYAKQHAEKKALEK